MSIESENSIAGEEDPLAKRFSASESQRDLKGKTIRGGLVTFAGQLTRFLCQTLSTVVLARLLSPTDFGLVGMVTAVTALLRIFQDSGLSMATVQSQSISHSQVSTVFWINTSLGLLLTCLSLGLAPVLAYIYQEPRLYLITLAMGTTFLLDAAGSQHQALLRRELKFKTLAIIDIIAMAAGVIGAIVGAWLGMGYWALVLMPVIGALVSLLATWIAEPWRPGLPHLRSGVGSMMRFGGYLTAVNFLGYLFRNVDNALIGWRWGAAPLGFYQKSYSLLMLPINQINIPIGSVVVSSLSRLVSDPERQRRYFVGGYTMATTITLPIVVASAIFAGDIIPFILGQQWSESVAIFRYLAPAALVGAMLNPFGALFLSMGRADRHLKGSLVWTPLILLGFVAGLGYGPQGVAIGYSVMSVLMAIPMALYAINGTSISLNDLKEALRRPSLAVILAGAIGIIFHLLVPNTVHPGIRAVGGCGLVVGIYAVLLFSVMKQWTHYVDIAAHCLPRAWLPAGQKAA